MNCPSPLLHKTLYEGVIGDVDLLIGNYAQGNSDVIIAQSMLRLLAIVQPRGFGEATLMASG
jgi:hypothetical protein